MKKSKLSLCLIPAMLFTSVCLTGCGEDKALATPTNLTFDVDTGTFKFDTVDGGEYYQITLSRRINKKTYDSLKDNQRTKDQAATVQIDDETTWYIWNENVTSASRLQDKKSKGYIESSFSLRTYSNSATSAGDPIEFSELAPGDYVLQAIANATDEKEESVAAIKTFTKGGTLAAPTGFTASVNDDGQLEIKEGSSYYYNALVKTGLPSEIKYEIKDGSTTLETITVDDFSWTSAIQGPTNAFTFNYATVTSAKKNYTKSKSFDYKITVTAVGDGSTVKDASAEGSYNHVYTVTDFDITATKTKDGDKTTYNGQDSLEIKINCDGTDYTLTAKKAETTDDNFVNYNIEDVKFGGTLTLAEKQSQGGWGPPTTSKTATLQLGDTSLSGSFTEEAGEGDNVTFKVTNVGASSGMGGMGGFPM